MQGGRTADKRFDVLIIGAGVVGSAAARELARYRLKIGVLDKIPDVCTVVPASAAAPVVLSPIPQMKKHATLLTLVKGRYTMAMYRWADAHCLSTV